MYILAMEGENYSRALTGIGPKNINFNLSAHMTFATIEEVEEFRKRWKFHFYPLEELVMREVRKKEEGAA